MASFYQCGAMLPRRYSRLSAFQNKSLPSPLIHLYDEIWTLILKKVTQNDALNLRVVDKNFKTKAENLYADWLINLDERCDNLNMILDLRVKHVVVQWLWYTIPNRPPGIILKFPDLLEKLQVLGLISAENLHILLQSKNLKFISIGSNRSVLRDVFWKTLDPLLGYNFPELRTLKIYIFPRVADFYEFFLTHSRMPKLTSLMVEFRGKYDPAELQKLTSTLLSFIGRHGQTLKHFTYTDILDMFFTEAEVPNPDESALQNCSTFETVKIFSHSNTKYLMDTWKRLIENQSKLIVLKIDAHLPLSTMFKVCAKNFRTLTKFDFDGAGSETEQYDLSIFSKCVNLKYLCLKMNEWVSNDEFFCNFETLPDQIETVIVNYFKIFPAEFSNFLMSHHSLSNLEIYCVGGYEGEFGLNSSVLNDILNHDSLKSVKIGRWCITKPNTQSELAELETFFSDLGYTKAWNEFEEFTLEKSSDSNTWVAKDR